LAASQWPDLILQNVGSAKKIHIFLKKKKKGVDRSTNGFYILQNVKAIPIARSLPDPVATPGKWIWFTV